MPTQAIRSIRRLGTRATLDFAVAHPDHNFYADGIVVSNSHAYEYAYLTAQTTYLKANYPREFVFAMLQLSKHEPDSKGSLHSIIAESKSLGIDILPPDIVKSGDDFTVEEHGVRFGLSHIRGISDATMTKLVSFRRDFATKFDVFKAAQEAKVNIATVVGLVLSGALDTKGTTRTKLALEAQAYNLLTPREVTLVHKLGAGWDLIDLIKDLKTKIDEKGKPYIKESRLETFRRDLKPYWDQYLVNSRNEEFAAYVAERHYLGFSYSNTLHNLFARKVQGLIPIELVLGEPKDIEVSFVAFVDEVKQAIGRESKKPYARFYLSDESGKIKAMISGQSKVEGCLQFNNGRLPAEGDAVIVHGKKGSDDLVWADSVIIQTLPVSMVRKKAEDKA